jgi:hypothetical protein
MLTQTPVTFTLSCAKDGFANIDQQVNTINGGAVAIYEDISCAGGNGNEDVIVASLASTILPYLLPVQYLFLLNQWVPLFFFGRPNSVSVTRNRRLK